MKYQINQRIGFATMGEIKPPQAANGVHFSAPMCSIRTTFTMRLAAISKNNATTSSMKMPILNLNFKFSIWYTALSKHLNDFCWHHVLYKDDIDLFSPLGGGGVGGQVP